MKHIYLAAAVITLLFLTTSILHAQYVDIPAADGDGVRFWSSDAFKIHMGNSSQYHYGPVTDYSIKFNMSTEAGRGWVWGNNNQTPIAALTNIGQMQLATSFFVGPYFYSAVTPGIISASGSSAEVSIGNRNATSFVSWPTNGERWSIYSDGSPGNLKFWSGTDKLTINNAGNVGIGTSAPGSFRLAVEGKIGAHEVNVTSTSPWPDYVFSADHKLPSLETIERYIQYYKHLPEVPTTKEVEEKGIDLGKMNALLLKKIEELTLYVIDQQKQIDELKGKIK